MAKMDGQQQKSIVRVTVILKRITPSGFGLACFAYPSLLTINSPQCIPDIPDWAATFPRLSG
jgi:hypothetical protein